MKAWIGPRDGDLTADNSLARDLPPERCPWCELAEHDLGCMLRDGLVRGAFCDCSASAADEFADDPKRDTNTGRELPRST